MAGHFPPARHRRMAAVVVAAASAVALTMPLASADDDLKDRQKRVEKQIDSAGGALEESSDVAAQAAAALHAAESRLHEAQGKLEVTRARLAKAQREDVRMQAMLDRAIRKLEVARAELDEGRLLVAQQKQAVDDLVASIYEQGDPRLVGLAAMADAEDPGDMTRAMAFNEAYNNRENFALDGFKRAERELARREAAVEEHKGIVAASRAKAAANLEVQRALEKKAKHQTDAVQVLVTKRADAHARAYRAQAHDRRVLAALQKQEQNIKEMLQARARAAIGSGGSRGGYLSYPVNAPITSPFGWRTHPIWGDRRLHNGIDFGAPCGAPMYAAADGVVLSRGGSDSDPSGNWLIVSWGARAGVDLTSSYNHATSYVVSAGQHLKRGQLVGYVGTTGWSTGCHLHFTVRENGSYVDPMKWL